MEGNVKPFELAQEQKQAIVKALDEFHNCVFAKRASYFPATRIAWHHRRRVGGHVTPKQNTRRRLLSRIQALEELIHLAHVIGDAPHVDIIVAAKFVHARNRVLRMLRITPKKWMQR